MFIWKDKESWKRTEAPEVLSTVTWGPSFACLLDRSLSFSELLKSKHVPLIKGELCNSEPSWLWLLAIWLWCSSRMCSKGPNPWLIWTRAYTWRKKAQLGKISSLLPFNSLAWKGLDYDAPGPRAKAGLDLKDWGFLNGQGKWPGQDSFAANGKLSLYSISLTFDLRAILVLPELTDLCV